MLYPPSVMRMAKPSAIVFFTFLGFFGLSYARLVTRTIDDSLGDPVGAGKVLYQPTSAWKNRTCPGCFSQPDQDKTLSGTWTSLVSQTSTPFVEIDFTGVAVSVYFIISPRQSTSCSFVLDGQPVGQPFNHAVGVGESEFRYDVRVFGQDRLNNTRHSLRIIPDSLGVSNLILFDYALYAQVETGVSNGYSITLAAGVIIAVFIGTMLLSGLAYWGTRKGWLKWGQKENRRGQQTGVYELPSTTPIDDKFPSSTDFQFMQQPYGGIDERYAKDYKNYSVESHRYNAKGGTSYSGDHSQSNLQSGSTAVHASSRDPDPEYPPVTHAPTAMNYPRGTSYSTGAEAQTRPLHFSRPFNNSSSRTLVNVSQPPQAVAASEDTWDSDFVRRFMGPMPHGTQPRENAGGPSTR